MASAASKPAGSTGSGSVQKSSNGQNNSMGEPPYIIGQKVENERFGKGVVTDIKPMSNDWLVTVEFEECGQKKMLTSFIKLNIL